MCLQPILLLSLLTLILASSLPAFDYVIIGGGTAGLTIANRLTELSNIRVAVIEAGDSVYNNPNVTNPERFTRALGTPIDWAYTTTNQTYADGRIISCPAGKALGGTSTINGMTYIRGEKAQIDVYESLGSKWWNWDSLFPYYKKAENFTIPTAAELEAGASYDLAYHGQSGPLKTGYPYSLLNGSFAQSVRNSWQELGIPPSTDVNGGHVRGFTLWQSTVNMVANLREDAARAYYYPFQSRPNLHIFLNTTANRIVWKNGSCSSAGGTAAGVEVTSANGTVSVLKAKREVVVSAGALRSPAILELSGIGNPSILRKYGIPTIVDLPAVGENLQDQPNVVFDFQSNSTNFTGLMPYVIYATLADFMSNSSRNLNLTAVAATVSAATNVSSSTLLRHFEIQNLLITTLSVPDAEITFGTTLSIGLPPSNVVYSAFWVLMPFSRGNVHISSEDPQAPPAINYNYFLVDYDLQVQVAIAKYIRKLWANKPMKGVAAEIRPGFTLVPRNASDEQWGAWVKDTFGSNSHPLGSAAMMSRELGGVVDNHLKVYGTNNVRVCDASVMPLQISGHLTATIYAIAERVSDLIKVGIR